MENSILSVNIQLQLDKNLVSFSLLLVPLLPLTTEVTLHIFLFLQGEMKDSGDSDDLCWRKFTDIRKSHTNTTDHAHSARTKSN